MPPCYKVHCCKLRLHQVPYASLLQGFLLQSLISALCLPVARFAAARPLCLPVARLYASLLQGSLLQGLISATLGGLVTMSIEHEALQQNNEHRALIIPLTLSIGHTVSRSCDSKHLCFIPNPSLTAKPPKMTI